jgi:competence protein ComEC
MQSDPTTSGPTPSGSAFAGACLPLFHAAWLFALGIAAARWLWLRPSLMLIALAATALVCGLAAVGAQRVAWLPLAVLWCLLGAWCAEMEPYPAPEPALAALSDNLLRTVEGTIVDAGPLRRKEEQDLDKPSSLASAQRPAQRVDVRVSSLEVVTDTFDLPAPAPGRVRLTVRWPVVSDPQPFRCGDHIRAEARLLPPEVYHDPGVWSRQDYLLDQGITSAASVGIAGVERLRAPSGKSLACRLHAWQQASSARMLALPAAMRDLPAPLRLSQDDAIMLAAMITGDRTYLTRDLRVGFERTGSFHMLVVSGFHLAIVAGCIFWVARKIRLPRVPATLITIAASFAYALFTGFATPVQRSLWMVTIYLLARLVYRERSAMSTIGFAALCLMAASPRSLFESSLQMTLLAVVAIGGIAAPLLERSIHPYLAATRDLRLIAIDIKLEPRLAQFRVVLRMIAVAIRSASASRMGARIAWRVFPWLVRLSIRIAELIVVSCVVELAMALPMAIYFNRITIFALPVNLLILPLLVVLMPAALVTLVTALAWPAMAWIPAMLVALPLHFGRWMVRLFGSMALADVRIPSPLLWQSAAFCALLAAAIVLARGTRRMRWAAWATLALAALAAVLPRPLVHPRNALLVEAIDVGQGDSVLLITPDGKTLLVDGGGFGGGAAQAPQEFDIGEEVVSPALWARGIRHLDVVALSHAHADHMGGLPAVLRNFHPGELWVGNNPRFAAYLALLHEADGLHVRVRELRAGDSLTLGSAKIGLLAPTKDYKPGPEPANNDSLVLHAAYGATSVLLEGDAEAPIEQAMLGETGLASTLLKVGHHGSITSTRPEFLSRVAPQWAVISCGLHNRYGHPRQEVLEGLQAAHVRTFSTDLNGASCFRLDGNGVQPEPDCGRQPLR